MKRFDLVFRNLAARKPLLWLLGSVLLVLLLSMAAAFLLDEPLRRKMEADMNNRLKGYTALIGRLDFHPMGFSLDLKDLTIYQSAHPDSPVLDIPKLSASIHWKALLRGRLVADYELHNPSLRLDLAQLRQEARDEIPFKEKGWREALRAIYPLKINQLVIRNGNVIYMEKGPYRPLRITKLNVLAENILNIESEEGNYPSPIEIDGIIFDAGQLTLRGNIDFLAEPHVALKGDFQIENVTLDYFKPISERYNLSVRKGVFSAHGSMEYASRTKKIIFKRITLDAIDADYIQEARATAGKEMAKEAGKAARKYSNEASLELKIDEVQVRNGQLGYINRATKPAYHVFFTDTRLDLQNFSNHLKDGIARGRATGKFMGSGPSQLEVAFRPENKGPDLNLSLGIENTDMRKMNDLFRAYGKFDVVAGVFSFYSEIKVRQGRIDGYVKPLFHDMDVYDERQDREKSAFRKLYEGLVGGISSLLKNQPREQVATQTSLSGDIESPQISTEETVLRLIQNAFFKTILPGFEKEVSQDGGARKRKPTS
jgi:Domain of Unknown Function (DUF748)